MTQFAHEDISIEPLKLVQSSLTIGLIMVRRENFVSCRREETAANIQRRNTPDYSTLPVVDDEGRILGLYDATRWFKCPAPDAPIGDDYVPLSEEILIGADASIFDFIKHADSHPTQLVIAGTEIAGLVSLSDVQQLPARAAIFALITSFEMTMARLIERKWASPEGWLSLLSADRQAKLTSDIRSAKDGDSFTGELVLTQFCDKCVIIRKGKLLGSKLGSLKHRLSSIERLRNSLAHASHYASSFNAARAVCEVVRDIYSLSELMHDSLRTPELSLRSQTLGPQVVSTALEECV